VSSTARVVLLTKRTDRQRVARQDSIKGHVEVADPILL
jgi:hypothetical protein